MIKLRNGWAGVVVLAGVLVAQAAWAGQLKDGIYWLQRQDFDRAQSILEAYSKHFPDDPRPYYYLSKCYENKFLISKVDQALDTYHQLSEKRDKILHTLSGADPISTYRAMLKDDPTDLSARLLLIVSLLENHVPMMAMAELEAVSSDQVPAQLKDVVHAMWGVLYQQQGNYAKAKEELQTCWRLNVNNPLPAKLLPQIAQEEQAQEQAQVSSDGLSSEPSASQRFGLTLKLGRDLISQGDFDGAIDALNEALSFQPDNQEAKDLLAQAKHQDAKKYYEIGVKFMRQQKFDAALASFNNALKFDPSFTKAQIAFQDAQQQIGAQQSGGGQP